MDLVVGEPMLDLVRSAYRADIPLLIEGVHGVGKSELLGRAAQELRISCTVIDLSLCEPVDLVGLPVIKAGRTEFAPPALLPTEGGGLLVLEEVNRAPRHVRAPCLQLLTARTLNGYTLPKGWLPVACANPLGDDEDLAYHVDELDPALRARFICVRAKPGLSEWIAWAKGSQVHAAVIETVGDAGLDALTKAGGNPRSWTYAGTFLRQWDEAPSGEQVLIAALVGLLGDRWGMVLARNYSSAEAKVAPADILDNFDGVRPTLDRWHRGKRLDLVRETWEALQRHLSSNATAKKVAANTVLNANARAFIRQLPADLRETASSWLDGQLASFVNPTPNNGVTPPRRGGRHGR